MRDQKVSLLADEEIGVARPSPVGGAHAVEICEYTFHRDLFLLVFTARVDPHGLCFSCPDESKGLIKWDGFPIRRQHLLMKG